MTDFYDTFFRCCLQFNVILLITIDAFGLTRGLVPCLAMDIHCRQLLTTFPFHYLDFSFKFMYNSFKQKTEIKKDLIFRNIVLKSSCHKCLECWACKSNRLQLSNLTDLEFAPVFYRSSTLNLQFVYW